MKNSLKKKLKQKKVTIGTWLTIPDSSIIEILCNSKFEWIVIDLEHSSMTIDQAANCIRLIDLSNKIPIVRVTDNDPNQIKRIMDAGSKGIIVPMINTVEEAEKAVAAVKYPPHGNRGVGIARAHAYGRNFKEYWKWQIEEPIIIVQIENIKAMKNIEKIFTTKGVDGFIVGPYDLSASMGIPGEFNNIQYKKILNKIMQYSKKYNCPAGIHVVEPNQIELKKNIKAGFKIIAYSVDIRILDSFVNETSKIIGNL